MVTLRHHLAHDGWNIKISISIPFLGQKIAQFWTYFSIFSTCLLVYFSKLKKSAYEMKYISKWNGMLIGCQGQNTTSRRTHLNRPTACKI